MGRLLRLSLVLVLAGTSALLASPQDPPVGGRQGGRGGGAPGGGRGAQPQTGTGVILGRVVDAASGEAISDALVSMSRTTLNAGGGGDQSLQDLIQSRMGGAGGPAAAQGQAFAEQLLGGMMGSAPGGPVRLLTDGTGHFLFRDLPKAEFSLTVTADGYIPGAAGQSRPNGPARAVELGDAERTNAVTIRLWKYAVITGTVTDDAGEPAVGATVRAFRKTMANGRPDLASAATDTTDDRGAYRLSSLIPGEYIVASPQTPNTMPTAMLDEMMNAVLSATNMGSMVMDIINSGPASANTAGIKVGDLLLQSSGNAGQLAIPAPTADGKLFAFQSVYYPSAPSPAQATAVKVSSGELRSNIDLQLRVIPTARVSGTVIGPKGGVGRANVRLLATGADAALNNAGVDIASTTTGKDGAFTFLAVPPGEFIVSVVQAARPQLPAEMSGNAMLALMASMGGGDEPMHARSPVVVTGADVTGLTLNLREGFKLSGRIEFQGQTPRPAQAMIQNMLSLTVTQLDGRPDFGFDGGGRGSRPDANSAFKTSGYPPGRYLLSTNGAPPGWIVKSITVNGRDASIEPFTLDADIADVVITCVDTPSAVSGTVRSPTSGPLTATVLLFPADTRGWIASGMPARRLRNMRASRTGAFSTASLLAGDYLIVAIDDADMGDPQDPAFITKIAGVATRITVAEADKKTVDLSIVKVPR